MQHTRAQWIHVFAMFAVASFFYLYEFLLRVLPSVMKPQLTLEFGIGAKEYGILAAIYYASYAPLQLPVGAWIDRFGPRRLLTLAVLMCAVSTLLSSYTQNYYIALVARFFIGAGSAFGFISCMKVLAVWFPPQWFPIMTGFTLTIGTMGAVASYPISLAMNYFDWRELLVVLGIIGLVLGAITWLVLRDDNTHQPSHIPPPEKAQSFWTCLKVVASKPQSWLVGFYAFLTTAPTDAFGGAWGVPFLTDAHGIDKDVASAAQSMVFLGMAIGSPLIGWVARRWNNRKRPMMLASMVASAALFTLIYSPTMTGLWAGSLFFTFGAFGTYVLAFVVIRHITHLQYVATAVGFVNMMSMIGSMLLTSAVGWILDTVRTTDLTVNGMPVYLLADYKIGLLALPIFYLVSALIIVPMIHDQPTEGALAHA